MDYVSIGAANAPATTRGSATRGSATCGGGVGAVGVDGGSGAMTLVGAGA